jgi:hypothetical protein
MTIDDYKLKLAEKILHSRSDNNIRRYIHVALKCLEEKKVHSHIIVRFVGKLILELENYTTIKERENSEVLNSQVAINELVEIKKYLIGKTG